MKSTTRLALSLTVAAGLAVPAVVDAQTAVPRPAGGSSAGSSSSGSSESGRPASGGAPDRPMSMGSIGSDQGGVRRNPEGSRSSGSASSRGTAGGRSSGSASSGSGSGGSATRGGVSGDRSYRDRDGRTTRGTAVERTRSNVRYISFGSWGWFPYYGFGYGYFPYDPWGNWYGGTRWRGSRYGWYAPYWYDPFDYYYGSGCCDRYEDEPEDTERRTGSVRLRVNQTAAGVYINGAFVGKVDDFDGLSDHLELEAGVHELEIRMDGYETYRGELTVEVGKTRTERLSLKKIK